MTFIFKLIWCFRVDFLETNKRIQLWLTGEEPWYLGGQYNKHTSAGLQPSSGLFLQPFSKELPKPDSFTHTHTHLFLDVTPPHGCLSGAQLIADLAHLQRQHTEVQFQQPSAANIRKHAFILVLTHTRRAHFTLQTDSHTNARTKNRNSFFQSGSNRATATSDSHLIQLPKKPAFSKLAWNVQLLHAGDNLCMLERAEFCGFCLNGKQLKRLLAAHEARQIKNGWAFQGEGEGEACVESWESVNFILQCLIGLYLCVVRGRVFHVVSTRRALKNCLFPLDLLMFCHVTRRKPPHELNWISNCCRRKGTKNPAKKRKEMHSRLNSFYIHENVYFKKKRSMSINVRITVVISFMTIN